MESPIFNNIEEECIYWKEKANHYYKECIESKQEFDEFVENSQQLEAEMEVTLEQKEKIIRDLRNRIVVLEKENESLRLKLDSMGIEFSNVQKQLTAIQRERDSMKSYLRQLEQKNDDLERAHRILRESLTGFEGMLDKAYEKNALLEMEVDEKEILQEKLQRLMDEARDLKHELNIKDKRSSSCTNGLVKNNIDVQDCNSVEKESKNIKSTEEDYANQSVKHTDNIINGNTMTASSRTTALNIVADMLRKLSLGKTLICPQCDRFRCVCENYIQNKFSASSTSVTSSSCSGSNVETNTFGTNFLKRIAQKLTSNLPEKTDHTMESRVKTYRDQMPTQKQ